MTNIEVATTGPKKVSLKDLHEAMDRQAPEFQAVLPAHIPLERFMRVLRTAVQLTPKLALVERRSLFTACVQAATDGLLPDGREGALIPFDDKKRGMIAQWMPMVQGIRKKVRNSGEISVWDAHCVYEKDEFEFELGDDPYIKHKPYLGADRGKLIAVYSVATLKGGEKSREVMSIAEINKIRGVSKAKDSGPWVDWPDQMAIKSVIKRHAKSLPCNTDLDDLIRRDDGLYDMQGASDTAQAAPKQRQALGARLEAIAGNGGRRTIADSMADDAARDAAEEVEHDPETGEIVGAHETHKVPPEAVESYLDTDEAKQILHEQARVQASEGSKALTKWLGRLDARDYAIVNSEIPELRKAAAKADSETVAT